MSALKGLFPFLEELANHNNREWFGVHKQEYLAIRSEWIAGIERFIAALSEHWPEIRYCDAAANTYRIYRDTRFSADKTPYKTHISSYVSPGLRHKRYAGVYVHADVNDDESGLYGGFWQPEAPLLRKMRNAIADNAEEFLEIVNEPELVKLYGAPEKWWGEALKTAPKGFAKDHEMIVYLRLKEYGKIHGLKRADFSREDWPEHLAGLSRPLLPLINFLNYTIDE